MSKERACAHVEEIVMGSEYAYCDNPETSKHGTVYLCDEHAGVSE